MVDIATDASLKPASHPKPLRVGLDIGSTTVKAVVLDQSDSLGDTLFSDYRRHHANVRATVAGLLVDIHKKLVDLGRGDEPIRLSITGSGGLALADNLHVPFIQEVIAETEAIDKEYPQADVIIELGGEDAKITYLKPTPEQRMNGSCAGGTGAFIDQMSTLLDTDAAGLNEMAKSYENLYPIASRCGVFAKTDLQPLINDGAAKPDLAASIFTAVATQTIAGLASGRPIHGTVIFLGGPLFFMSELRAASSVPLKARSTSSSCRPTPTCMWPTVRHCRPTRIPTIRPPFRGLHLRRNPEAFGRAEEPALQHAHHAAAVPTEPTARLQQASP